MALTNASAQGYTQYTYTVTATGATSVLEFDARQDPSQWDLDNISVTAIGAPAPAAPTIASFSTDSGVVGDGITNDKTLTLTGTAVANSTVNVYDGATLLGTATANGSGAWSYTTADFGQRQPQLYGDRHDVGHDQCGLLGAERDRRYHGAGQSGDLLVLDRQRHGRRRHHQ